MNDITNQLLSSPWFHGAVGLSVGVGLMILLLAKWGRRIFTGDTPTEGENPGVIQRLWNKINDIESRQVSLRTIQLPQDYVNKNEFRELHEGQIRIERKLDEFMADCRRGDCAAGRQFRQVQGERA